MSNPGSADSLENLAKALPLEGKGQSELEFCSQGYQYFNDIYSVNWNFY